MWNTKRTWLLSSNASSFCAFELYITSHISKGSGRRQQTTFVHQTLLYWAPDRQICKKYSYSFDFYRFFEFISACLDCMINQIKYKTFFTVENSIFWRRMKNQFSRIWFPRYRADLALSGYMSLRNIEPTFLLRFQIITTDQWRYVLNSP